MLTRSAAKKQKLSLISATRVTNYVKNDMIIDYLDKLDENGQKLNDNLEIVKKRTRSDDFDTQRDFKTKSSFEYIVESGYTFENDIIIQIKSMMSEKREEDKILTLNETDLYLNCEKTMEAIISNKYTLILGAQLLNNENNTWGKPDILAKGIWIQKYINTNMEMLDISKWYVIDIKSSTIDLIKGGEDISSKLLLNTYKSQIYIYTCALNKLMQEHCMPNNVSYGFILGKKYKYVVDKNKILKKPFECLGIIDFSKDLPNGDTWDNIVSRAVEWNKDLRLNWENFNVCPINRDELYPNMKNNYDKKWHNVKKLIASKNKEITLMWYCGIANRKNAWEKGIRRYDDPKLSAKILGFENTSKELIIDTMLKILHTDKKFILSNLNNYEKWQTKTKWEFFIDFETYNNDAIYDENYEWIETDTSSIVMYMIGVSYFDSENKLIHKSFIIKYHGCDMLKNEFDKINAEHNFNTNELSSLNNVKFDDCIFCSDEKDLIKKFVDFIVGFKPNKMSMNTFKKQTRLCHWSSAEPVIFNKKVAEYGLCEKTTFSTSRYNLEWFDLLKIFKHDKYPIIIKECFGFGLKEIVKKLNHHGLINLTWSDLDDGLLSSFIARDIYTKGEEGHNKQMYNIIEYNYIDCKALHYVLDWMRKVVNP